jgi:hypothetical protein
MVVLVDEKEEFSLLDRADAGLFGAVISGYPIPNSKRAEQHIGVEAVEFDHDSGRDGEPDRCKDRSCGEELFHGFGSRGCGWNERINLC